VRPMIVMGSFQTGGAERLALELVRRWSADGIESVVVTMRGGGELAGEFARCARSVYDGLIPGRFDVRGPWRFARLMRRHRTDALIIVDPLRNGLFHAIVGSVLSGGGMVRLCWCHSSPAGQDGRFVGRLCGYLWLGLLDAVICVSRAQRGELQRAGVPRRRLVLVRNGLDVESSGNEKPPADLTIPPGKRRIVTVANAMPDKDYKTLFEAFGMLAKRRNDVHLICVGRGTDQPGIGKMAELAPTGTVSLLGPQKDVRCILESAAVFVLASRSETFGLAVGEAMSAGVPVVVSDLPALSELVGEGMGLRVRPGDPAGLAEAIERLLNEPALASVFSHAARRQAEKFTVDKMEKNLARLIQFFQIRKFVGR